MASEEYDATLLCSTPPVPFRHPPPRHIILPVCTRCSRVETRRAAKGLVGRGRKEKEEVRLVRHGGWRAEQGGGGPPTALLYILLLAVNSTDLHKETNAPLSLGYSLAARKIARSDTHTHTHTHTYKHTADTEWRGGSRRLSTASDLPDRLFRCSVVVVVGVRAKFSPVRGRAKLGERAGSEFVVGIVDKARRISPARGLCETWTWRDGR